MWDKRHDVPEGLYKVRLVDVKCHNRETYKLQVEVLQVGVQGEIFSEPKIITGYARRFGADFGDLAACFGSGEIYKKSNSYKGLTGFISMTHSGWMTLVPRDCFENTSSKNEISSLKG